MIRIGQRLKEARIEQGLSLEDASAATKIRASFLSAIEKGEYHRLPSTSYAQGFVRNYGEYLGLSQREVLALFRREFDEEKAYKVLPQGFVKKDALAKRGVKIHQAVLLVIFAIVFLGGFLLFQYRAAFLDPSLRVTSPEENTVTGTEITVTGEADPTVTLTINNTPVTVTQQGEFSKKVTAFPGNTTIVIKAVNSFGRETIIERPVEVKTTP
jgi:cytoskeletal protein RodZ